MDPGREFTLDVVVDTVGLVDRNPYDRAVLEKLSPLELRLVYDWAIREHLAAAGNRVRRRARPFCLSLAVLPRVEDVEVERVLLYLAARGSINPCDLALLRCGAWREVGPVEAAASILRRCGDDYALTAASLPSDCLVAERIAGYVDGSLRDSASVDDVVSAIRAGLWRESPEADAVARLIGLDSVPSDVDAGSAVGRMLAGSGTAALEAD